MSPSISRLTCRTAQGFASSPRPQLTEPSRDAAFLTTALSIPPHPPPLPPLSLLTPPRRDEMDPAGSDKDDKHLCHLVVMPPLKMQEEHGRGNERLKSIRT